MRFYLDTMFLFFSGADIECKTLDLVTPLMIASRFGNLECISLLLASNADVRQTDKDDKNSLMYAAEEDRVDAIKVSLPFCYIFEVE